MSRLGRPWPPASRVFFRLFAAAHAFAPVRNAALRVALACCVGAFVGGVASIGSAQTATKNSAEAVQSPDPLAPSDALEPVEAARAASVAERRAMAAQIDRRIAERLTAAGATAAPLADDSEFLRRLALDLTGVTPRVSEVREFLADDRADKRERWIERLTESPAHANHLANRWRELLLPEGAELERPDQAAGVQNWLRKQFTDNVRYDRFVSEFLVAREGSAAGPALFYTSLELKPEKLAASTARIFLGLQIECAECHHHPFDHWKQEQFWGYAAFFARLRRPGPNAPVVGAQRLEDLEEGEVMLPKTDAVVAPRFPGAAADAPPAPGTRREQLAIWMASRDNPYLARAAVNRIWAHLFGRGLVEPLDDLSPLHPPTHPELLDELTDWFVRRQFDQRELYRLLTSTAAYQRTSRWKSGDPPPVETYARMLEKPLGAEPLYDSLLRLVARPPVRPPRASAVATLGDPRRSAFVAKMRTASRSAVEYQAGVLQALTLMNGDETATVANPEQGSLLASLEAPFFSPDDRLEILFLATLSRPPSAAERAAFLEHVEQAGDRRKAWSDALWAIVNSAEFTFNH